MPPLILIVFVTQLQCQVLRRFPFCCDAHRCSRTLLIKSYLVILEDQKIKKYH